MNTCKEQLVALELRNFQSHRDTRLALGPGLNVVVGPSDVGKSALVRALRWVVFNRPSGDSFRSEWGGDTEAILRLSSGAEVRRARSSSFNGYELRRATTAGQPHGGDRSADAAFAAIKTEVPPEVAAALRLGELNFQGQHDAPFAVSLTGGALARALNEVVDLSAIDRALAAGAAQVRAQRAAADAAAADEAAAGAEAAALEAAVAPARAAADAAGKAARRTEAAAAEHVAMRETTARRTEAAREWGRKHAAAAAARRAADLSERARERCAARAAEAGCASRAAEALRAALTLRTKAAEAVAERRTGLVTTALVTVGNARRDLEAAKDVAHKARRAEESLRATTTTRLTVASWHADCAGQAEEARERHRTELERAGVCPLCGRSL